MSGAMQRETEKAEELDLEQKPKTTTIDDRLLVVSYPNCLSMETRARIEHYLGERMREKGLEVIVLDSGAEVYRPNLLGQARQQLAALEAQVAALSDMVERIVAAIEDEGEPESSLTLDGDPGGKPREPGSAL